MKIAHNVMCQVFTVAIATTAVYIDNGVKGATWAFLLSTLLLWLYNWFKSF